MSEYISTEVSFRIDEVLSDILDAVGYENILDELDLDGDEIREYLKDKKYRDFATAMFIMPNELNAEEFESLLVFLLNQCESKISDLSFEKIINRFFDHFDLSTFDQIALLSIFRRIEIIREKIDGFLKIDERNKKMEQYKKMLQEAEEFKLSVGF